jgi:DNA polymerase III delta' subunit
MKKRAEVILEGLRRAAGEGRLHHAYLLTGPETRLKADTAERLAASFAPPSLMAGADEDAVVERIRRGNHPDFVRLVPENELINVEAVRTLPKALSFPPLELSRRVVLIEGAQGMNVQASNALLKILEEPPAHTMFFLLCREPSDMLQTIVSRCQALRFPPLGEAELREQLGDGDPARIEAALAWSEGSLTRAREFLENEVAAAVAREACENALLLWEASPRVPSAVVQWAEALEEPLVPFAVDTWELLLRDLSFAAAGAKPEALRFPAYHARLSALGRAGGASLVNEAAAKNAVINRFRVYRDFNGNLRLDFAALLTELQINSVGKRREMGVN